MIPVEIELHNFLAYRSPPPLLLEGIHVACLAGPNGAGKSSLLDALTWALWKKARAKGPDDLLVHQGQSEMRVVVTFDQEGRRYRVQRQPGGGERGCGGRPSAWSAGSSTSSAPATGSMIPAAPFSGWRAGWPKSKPSWPAA